MSSQRSSSRSTQGSQRSRSSGRNTNTKNINGSKKQRNNNASHRKRKTLNTVQVAAQRHLHAKRASSVSSSTSSKRGSQSSIGSNNKSKKSITEAQRNAKVKCVGNKQITKSRITRRRGDLHAQEAPSWSTAIIEHTNQNSNISDNKKKKMKKNEKTNRTSWASMQEKSKTTKHTSSTKNSTDKNGDNTKQKKKGKGLTKEMLTCELCKLRKDEWEFCGLTGNRHVIDTVDDGNTSNEPVVKEEHKEMHTELKQEVMM